MKTTTQQQQMEQGMQKTKLYATCSCHSLTQHGKAHEDPK